jgi:anti-sigma factor RsiW
MSDRWTDRLSEYLDGELSEDQRAELEAHLAICGACTTTLAELQRVVARARALEDRPPATDLWPGIAARIGVSTDQLAARRGRRRFSFTVPQLIAASLVLITVSAGAVALALRPTSAPAVIAPASGGAAPAPSAHWATRVEASADRAVAQLEQALVEGRRSGRLDSLTVRTLEHSLAVIDTAIAEARRAVAADPTSAYLNLHLADTMRRKLRFLRQATRIAAART